jgi:hypothetical protein
VVAVHELLVAFTKRGEVGCMEECGCPLLPVTHLLVKLEPLPERYDLIRIEFNPLRRRPTNGVAKRPL